MRRYDPGTIEPKWVAAWEAEGLYRADDEDASRPKFYALDMFPYPSGDLHIGHAGTGCGSGWPRPSCWEDWTCSPRPSSSPGEYLAAKREIDAEVAELEGLIRVSPPKQRTDWTELADALEKAPKTWAEAIKDPGFVEWNAELAHGFLDRAAAGTAVFVPSRAGLPATRVRFRHALSVGPFVGQRSRPRGRWLS